MYSIFMKSQYDRRRPVHNIRQFIRQCRWGVQRIRRGYSDWDAGEIDSWITYILPDMIGKFMGLKGDQQTPFEIISDYYDQHKDELGVAKEEFFGCPENLPEEKREKIKAGLKNASDEWEGILEEMRQNFYMADDGADEMEDRLLDENIPFCDERWNEIENIRQESWEKGCELLKKWGRWLWI